MKSIKLGLLIGATIISINTMKSAQADLNKIYNKIDSDTGKIVHWIVNPSNMVGYMDDLGGAIDKLSNGDTPVLTTCSITSFQ